MTPQYYTRTPQYYTRTLQYYTRKLKFREGFVHVFCWCPCRQCKRTRTRLRFRRTLFPTSANAMSEKYTDRNGSMMHTMTEYVDNDSNATRRSHLSNMVNNRASPRKADDFV
ncbi:hypothetical protein MAR_028460 [Mya arenaria]|uniref:Uncharacterized protein n=1 Tax=Mya arenaria TaxID=6604 RepID=A0ABY7DHG5_MYAAR|nr:hypothetical protein MAR_028460 [Mya arenaria]